VKPASAGRYTPPEPAMRLRVPSSDGVQLNVEIHGSPAARGPAVVLIHGNTCSTSFWAPVIRALREDLRIVVYDQRGHGGSDIPDRSGYSVEALASDLAAVLEQTLPAAGKAVLAGHSMGGIAIMAAASRNDVIGRVSGALLASTGCADLIAEALVVPFGGFVPPLAAAVQHWMLTSAAPLEPFFPLSRTVLSYLTLGPDASAEVAAVNAAVIQACDRQTRAAWGEVLSTVDVTEGVRRLDVPVHVLVGSADRLTPPAHARRIAELLPRCEGLTQLPRIGHMTPLEAPEEVAELIRKLAAGSAPGQRPASLAGRSRNLRLAGASRPSLLSCAHRYGAAARLGPADRASSSASPRLMPLVSTPRSGTAS
jgi:pimeloyl-ACP methyl ester carboxylesterase